MKTQEYFEQIPYTLIRSHFRKKDIVKISDENFTLLLNKILTLEIENMFFHQKGSVPKMRCPYCEKYDIEYTQTFFEEQNGDIILKKVHNYCKCGHSFDTYERYKLEDEDYTYDR